MSDFRAVYEREGVYDVRLLPHYFHGKEDVDLVGSRIADMWGPARGALRVAEFGCGTGRVTSRLEPFAIHLTLADYSAVMTDAVGSRFPDATIICADTRDAVRDLVIAERRFDVVGAFWSLSYPIGEFFESLSASGVLVVDDHSAARDEALRFVRALVSLLAPEGQILVLFFDPDTEEQRFVTRLWERVAPFPAGGRDYGLQVLLDGLRAAENAGEGVLTHTRLAGAAWAPDRSTAEAWFLDVHLKGLPALVRNQDVGRAVATFVRRFERATGDVVLPSGVHVIEFRRADHPHCHIPGDR